MANAGGAVASAGHPEPSDRTGARWHRATEATTGPKAARLVPGLARHPGVGVGDRREARAHPHERGNIHLKPLRKTLVAYRCASIGLILLQELTFWRSPSKVGA